MGNIKIQKVEVAIDCDICKKRIIVIIDNENLIHMMLSELIINQGWSVIECGNNNTQHFCPECSKS